MGLYERLVLPRLVHFTCGLKPARLQREKIVPAASGVVLEIGFGSGRNLPYYDPRTVEHVWALEPSPEMWALARDAVEAAAVPVELVEAPAEEMPLDDRSVDTVLLTYVLCTLAEVDRALGEVRRVLKQGGRLVFCEHGAAPDETVLRWQNRLDPLWRRLAGGCHLNRPIPALIEAGGFRIENLETMYIPGWRPASFNYWGSAIPG